MFFTHGCSASDDQSKNSAGENLVAEPALPATLLCGHCEQFFMRVATKARIRALLALGDFLPEASDILDL